MLRVCGPILKNGLTTGPAQNRTATRMGQGFECNSQHKGHASVTQTLDTYSHVLPALEHRATDELRNILFPVEDRPADQAVACLPPGDDDNERTTIEEGEPEE